MVVLCKCANTFGNTGQSKCFAEQFAEIKEYWIPKYDSEGNLFKIDPQVAINQAFIDARVNDLDSSKRWRPIDNIKTVTGERADGDVETFDDKTENRFENGVRNNAFLVDGGSPAMLEEILSYKCDAFVTLTVDKAGNLIGVKNGTDGYMYGQEVDYKSLNAKFVKGAQAARMKISVAYNYVPSMRDENLVQINAANITGDIIGAKGLYNVYATISDISTTGFKIKLFNNQGDLVTPIVEEGLVTADFISSDSLATSKIYNQTNDADVTITSANETAPGEYDIVFAAQTAGDKLIPFAKKNGRDFAPIQLSVVTIV